MTLMVPQPIIATGTTPTPITPTASDTIAGSTAGTDGWDLRIITTGTASNISVLDPNSTIQGNPGTVTPIAAPATGVRMVLIPKSAINPATGLVTITNTSVAGMTYELYID